MFGLTSALRCSGRGVGGGGANAGISSTARSGLAAGGKSKIVPPLFPGLMFGLTPACSIAPLNPVLSCAVNRGGVGGGGANAGIRSTCLGAVTTGGKPKPVPVLFPASALCLNDSSGVCETGGAGLAGPKSSLGIMG